MQFRTPAIISTSPRLSLFAMLVLLAAAAWSERWSQDDAYITYRYSEHMARGLGAVWNPGESVEGYTNFLWMLMLAGASRLGFGLVEASQLLGIACFVCTLIVAYELGKGVLSPGFSLLATVLVGTNYSMLAYATGGLETQLYALLTTSLLLQAQRGVIFEAWSGARLAGISLLMAGAVMTRPDGALVCAVAGGAGLLGIVRTAPPGRERIAKLLLLGAPVAALVGTWLAWKLSVYGSLIPNTAQAKLGTSSLLTYLRGSAYVGMFFLSYWLAPTILFLVVLHLVRRRPLRVPSGCRPLIVYLALWLAYVVGSGGDIMEFRQMIPALPALYVVMVAAISMLAPDPRRVAAAVAFLCVGNAVHATFFPAYARPEGIGNVPQLATWVGRGADSWATIGRALGAALQRDPSVTIAVTTAGAIPYFSGVRAIDMLGLNDAWVARHGYRRKLCGLCYAHARLATVEYLRRSGTHLIIGYPSFIPLEKPIAEPRKVVRRMFWHEEMDYQNLPDGARLLRIPLGERLALAAVYIAPHPRVDDLIASGSWRAESIRRFDEAHSPGSVLPTRFASSNPSE